MVSDRTRYLQSTLISNRQYRRYWILETRRHYKTYSWRFTICFWWHSGITTEEQCLQSNQLAWLLYQAFERRYSNNRAGSSCHRMELWTISSVSHLNNLWYLHQLPISCTNLCTIIQTTSSNPTIGSASATVQIQHPIQKNVQPADALSRLILQDTIRKTRNVTENELFIPHPQLTACVSIQKKLKDATEGKVL